jgi:hypothetical protein
MDPLVWTKLRISSPIYTYSGRATTKPGVRAAEHGIVYSWGGRAELLPGEVGITKTPLPVVMSESHTRLDKASRIYYGIHHPIQYNNKVKDVGYVPGECIPSLIGNWKAQNELGTEQGTNPGTSTSWQTNYRYFIDTVRPEYSEQSTWLLQERESVYDALG